MFYFMHEGDTVFAKRKVIQTCYFNAFSFDNLISHGFKTLKRRVC